MGKRQDAEWKYLGEWQETEWKPEEMARNRVVVVEKRMETGWWRRKPNGNRGEWMAGNRMETGGDRKPNGTRGDGRKPNEKEKWHETEWE